MMKLVKGDIISNSDKQKLNMNSSTEGELVVTHEQFTEGELVTTHDQLPGIMHTLYFIEAQGYTIDKNIIYKDNKSTIRLEVNGRISSGKKTNHISSSFSS